MGQMYEAVVQHLKEEGLHFQQFDERHRVSFGMQGRNCNFNVTIQVREETTQMMIHSQLPVNCPEERRLAMCEFITRVNYGLVLGNWEMDMVDGEVRYKTSIDSNGQELTRDLIQPLLRANLSMANRFSSDKGLMRVMFGDGNAREAVEALRPQMSLPSESAEDGSNEEDPESDGVDAMDEPDEKDSTTAELRRRLDELLRSGVEDEEPPF